MKAAVVKVFMCVIILLIMYRLAYTTTTTATQNNLRTAAPHVAVTDTILQQDNLIKSKSKYDVRISNVWIIRERRAALDVLLLPSNTSRSGYWHLPREESFDYEIPKLAALRVLLGYGLGQHEVETMHILRHGEFLLTETNQLLHDATSYVAVVTGEHVDIVTQMASKMEAKAQWFPFSDIAQSIENGVGKSGLVVESMVVDDLSSARWWLDPFVKTAGKNPVKCLGKAPQGWTEKTQIVWPTVREREKE